MNELIRSKQMHERQRNEFSWEYFHFTTLKIRNLSSGVYVTSLRRCMHCSMGTQQNKKEIKGGTAYIGGIRRKHETERDQNNCSVAYLEELVTTMTMDKGS